MKTATLCSRWTYAAALVLVGLAAGSAPGQAADDSSLPRFLDLVRAAGGDAERPSALRGRCVRFFRMPSGIAGEPVGADLDNDQPPGDAGGTSPEAPDLPVQAALYTDNPYFDFRRPGDVGGPGYYRIHTQVQLVETDTTGCTLGLQAVTPAGQENDGLADGPTVFYPNLALVQQLFDGLSFEGFVGKTMRARPGWEDHVGRSLHYGVALAHPVPGFDAPSLPQVHVFVEALGRYRIAGAESSGTPAVWELLPGLHWRMGDSWWLSGGVIVPLNAGPRETGLWQVTCSWTF
jgi:hypothetical protein